MFFAFDYLNGKIGTKRKNLKLSFKLQDLKEISSTFDLRPVLFIGIILILFAPIVKYPFLNVIKERRYKDVAASTVLSPNDYKAILWIEQNLPENTIFLNDGGGTNGWGGGCDAGEWISPISGRTVLMSGNFISEDFWEYDLPSRFEVLKEVSRNPDSPKSKSLLEKYNVTHAYIGNKRNILTRSCLLDFTELNNSSTFNLIYDNESTYIFEVNK